MGVKVTYFTVFGLTSRLVDSMDKKEMLSWPGYEKAAAELRSLGSWALNRSLMSEIRFQELRVWNKLLLAGFAAAPGGPDELIPSNIPEAADAARSYQGACTRIRALISGCSVGPPKAEVRAEVIGALQDVDGVVWSMLDLPHQEVMQGRWGGMLNCLRSYLKVAERLDFARNRQAEERPGGDFNEFLMPSGISRLSTGLTIDLQYLLNSARSDSC